tara:strand:- start:4506 stop:4703 length:198 start_codon:yes stop_codon:yes gene_type:complete
MATTRQNPLPVPSPSYNPNEEATNRRTIEFALDRLENEVLVAKTQDDKTGSLSMRRFQFLLMGAS